MTQSHQPQKLYPHIGNTISMLVVCATLLALPTLSDMRGAHWVFLLPLYACLLVAFALQTARKILRFVLRRPALVIDDNGITDNVSFLSVGLIRWDQIDHIFSYQRYSCFGAESCLGIVPKDLDSLLIEVHPLRKLIVRANLLGSRAPINITTYSLSHSPNALFRLIAECAPEMCRPLNIYHLFTRPTRYE